MAGEIGRTALGSTCTAVRKLGNRHHSHMEGEWRWVHLNGETDGWPVFDRKLVGKDIARLACDNFQYSTPSDPGIVERDKLTNHLECRLRTAEGLGATSERR